MGLHHSYAHLVQPLVGSAGRQVQRLRPPHPRLSLHSPGNLISPEPWASLWRQTARVLSAGVSGNPALRRESYLESWTSADPRFRLQLHKSRLNFLLSDHPSPRVLEGEPPLNTSWLWLTDTTELGMNRQPLMNKTQLFRKSRATAST